MFYHALNGYPPNFTNNSQQTRHRHQRKSTPTEETHWFYLKVPCFRLHIDRKIFNVFPVCVTHKGTSLRQALRKKEHLQRTCTRIGCTISDGEFVPAKMWSMKLLANSVPTYTSTVPSGNYMIREAHEINNLFDV